jgi:predicted acetyltransferase
MNNTIRQLQGDEMLGTLYSLNSYALHPSPPLQNMDEWMAVVRPRRGICCQAMFEDETPVAVVASTPLTQNMRGKLYPTSGIWGVSTAPGARRRGYCRQLMASLLSANREQGKYFSSLYPFRESFYERLGYISFPLTKIAHFYTESLAPLLKMDSSGEIRLQYMSEAYETYRQYLESMRSTRHGMAMFDYPDWAHANQNLVWTASAVFGGDIEGIMLYRTLGKEVTKYTFMASRFYYQTSRARYLLLNWIAHHIDQAEQVEMWLPEDEYPENWLADVQVKVETAIRPGMSRVLDVEHIAGMQVGEGRFSARISDPLCPWNEGAWHFESREKELQVSKAPAADCELTIQGLSALINGTHDPQDIPLRGWGDPSPAVQLTMQEMFPRMRPFMHEMF